ncbi:hypothetical protein P8452_61667 [Trifolium repens]|nr:hypothetical protein P8452_61667 [Trifolium repens]
MRATQTFQANINLLAKGTELARNGRMVVKAVVKTNAKRRRRHIDEEYRRENWRERRHEGENGLLGGAKERVATTKEMKVAKEMKRMAKGKFSSYAYEEASRAYVFSLEKNLSERRSRNEDIDLKGMMKLELKREKQI